MAATAVLSTRLTRLLNIRTPVVCPPMANASGGALAAAVTEAGGFGFIGTGALNSVPWIHQQLDLTRSTPVGVGFLGWLLASKAVARDVLAATLERNVTAVWFSFGDNLRQWVDLVRQDNQQHGTRTVIFVQVGSVADAKEAANWGIDVLVVQGSESGGHGVANAPPVRDLLRDVLAQVPESLPILPAGGFNNGTQLASLIRTGASGMVVGTAFLPTPESTYSEAQKQALIKATAADTVRTLALDEVRDTLGWPAGVDGRALRNAAVRERDAGISVEEVKANFARAGTNHEDGMIVWAGTGVSEISGMSSVDDFVNRIHTEAAEALMMTK